MSIDKDIEQIMESAHFWNWLPDWGIVKEVYRVFPDAHSVLTPFAYAYLEELIRSMTTEYGTGGFDEYGNPRKYTVGKRLIKLAIEENKTDNPGLVMLLEQVMKHFANSHSNNNEQNRNSVVHGYKHSRFWDRDSFETLVHDIALLSKHARF
jgi:hypothetical protein